MRIASGFLQQRKSFGQTEDDEEEPRGGGGVSVDGGAEDDCSCVSGEMKVIKRFKGVVHVFELSGLTSFLESLTLI